VEEEGPTAEPFNYAVQPAALPTGPRTMFRA